MVPRFPHPASTFTLLALLTVGFVSDKSYAARPSEVPAGAHNRQPTAALSNTHPDRSSAHQAAPVRLAQFGGLKLPFPIPGGGGSPGGILQGAAMEQAMRALGKQFQSDSPITSNPKDILPTVAELPGGPFNPSADIQEIIRQLRTSRDGTVMLLPGDYLTPVDVFCMKATAHSPDGHRYLLARLKGKMADVITALNTRSIGSGIPHTALQVLSWNIQAGMKYDEMSADNQRLIDQLLPDFKKRMSRSFYEQLQGTWDGISRKTGLPSMDSSIDKLGDVGHAITTLRETRNTLLQYASDNREIARRLVPASPAEQGWDTTPWSQISDRVFGRLITPGNYSSAAKLQIRVLPVGGLSGYNTDDNLKPGHLFLAKSGSSPAAKTDVTDLVGNPQDSGVQPLSMSPDAGSGSGPSQDSSQRPGTGVGHRPDKWKTDYPRKTFQDCEGAAHFINNNPDNVAAADVKLKSTVSPITITKQPDGSYKAQEIVTWSVDPATTQITLPAWSWPNMTPAGQAALDNYTDALRVHEEGHVAVAEKTAETLSGPRFGTGATPQQATDDLKQILETFKQTAAKSLQQQDEAYDQATQHGGAQKDGPDYGFPGGNNVELNCP